MLHLSKLPFRRSSNNEIGFEIIYLSPQEWKFCERLFSFLRFPSGISFDRYHVRLD